jgi:hypothetical protein
MRSQHSQHHTLTITKPQAVRAIMALMLWHRTRYSQGVVCILELLLAILQVVLDGWGL